MSGGIFSDRAIADAVVRKAIVIDPFDAAQLNPASYDMTLGDKVSVYSDWVLDERVIAKEVAEDPFRKALAVAVDIGLFPQRPLEPRDGRHLVPHFTDVPYDVKTEPNVFSFTIGEEGWVLKPGILYLMHTREVIGPGAYVATADGKSSLGRLGIVVHQTAGYVDPGFVGQITLEVTVSNPIRVYAGMRFAQVRFHTTLGESSGYKGNYVGEHARGPVPSRAWKQFQ